MCGIVSIWKKSSLISADKLKAAVTLLKSRGPDTQKIWLSGNQHVGLAHTRLSIIDLVTGDQPLHSQDGSVHAVVNGEFYDYERIRATLIKKGYSFATQTDSEIILALYQEYGTDCLQYLNGEFAFVLYDQRRNLLFAARDRFGVKPLYYALYQGNLYLASEGKAILQLGVPAKWNEDALWLYLNNVHCQSYSCFQGINYIKPGHYLLANMDKDDLKQIVYWDLSFPSVGNFSPRQDKEYIATFQQLFNQAVVRRLRADVPIGCYLSGGIDSSAIAVTAAEHYKSLTAFTVAFEESDELNEFQYAKELTDKTGIRLLHFPVVIKDIVDHYAATLWHTEWPIANGNSVAKFLLSQFVHSQHYRVVLTGEGADELLAGYPHLWFDCLKYSNDKKDKEIISNIEILKNIFLNDNKLSSEVTKKILEKMGYVPAIFESTYYHWAESFFSDAFKSKYQHRLAALEFLNQLILPKNIAYPNMSLYLQIKSFFPIDTLNITGDRVEMAHAVEGRTPFLDNDLVDFMLTLPPRLKARGMVAKYILRKAMQHKITEAIYRREKHGFEAPTVQSHARISSNAVMFDYMREIFNSDLLLRVPFLNQQVFLKYFNHTVSTYSPEEINTAAKIEILYIVLSLCLLGEQFNLT